MKNMQKLSNTRKKNLGFTLIELMVSMAIFLLISSAAFRLFSVQQKSSSLLNDQVGLNLSLRNTVAQMQLDISNAGSGYFQGLNIPSWPVGLSIINNVVTSGNTCYDSTAKTYGWKCFDRVSVITAADPTNFPPANATDTTGGAGVGNCSNTESGAAYVLPTTVSGLTLAQQAATYKRNDQLLLLTASGQNFTTVVLTADGAVDAGGKAVKLVFNATVNYTISGVTRRGYNSNGNDPLDITDCQGNAPCSLADATQTKLTNTFCGQDWVIKLAPIQYYVCSGPGSPSNCANTTSTSPDIQNPKLMRLQNGTASVVMDQVIGFKVGASIYNSSNGGTSTTLYQYDAANYSSDPTAGTPTPDKQYNFDAVRSVRASLIARTTPNYSATYAFRNTFDAGPYQVQGIAVIVNPRNMSMND
jgi:prepilin-type N-terminal cleavage/methylation domain-containing protein